MRMTARNTGLPERMARTRIAAVPAAISRPSSQIKTATGPGIRAASSVGRFANCSVAEVERFSILQTRETG
jgi:hypothetical protein